MAEFDPYGVTQAYTHQTVLTLGSEILTKTLDHEEHERLRAIEDAIERTRIMGENSKIIALEKLAKKDAAILAESLKDLDARCKLHEEGAVDRKEKEWMAKMAEGVKFEKDYSDRRLVENIMRVEEKCEKVKVSAVAEARQEEQIAAAHLLKALEQKMSGEHALAIEQLRAEHQTELAKLTSTMLVEKDREICKAVTESEACALERLTKVKIDHDAEVSRYKAAVSAEQARTEEVRLELEKEVHARVIAQDKLQDVKEEFKYFINTLPGHENSSYCSDYMVNR